MQPTQAIHILIIDDDRHMRTALTALLEAQGHRIVTATAGAEGLQIAQAAPPDLVLLDVMMPGMDGFMVCEKLRGHPSTAEVPIVMITSLNDRSSRLRGIEAGADEFLTKPLDIHEVRLRVQTLARVNRYRRLLDEREQTVAALMQARDAALEASRIKSAFLSTVSHELRTPLVGIMGLGELLLDTQLTSEQSWLAEAMQRSGRQLLALISDILMYTSLDADITALQSLPFDIVAAITSVVESMRLRAEQKGLELRVTIDEALTAWVAGDEGYFNLMLTKLLDNAIKFTEVGAIDVIAQRQDETPEGLTLALQIRDSGIGVSAAIRPLLFKPFQQADGSTTRSYGGLGLGLAISKRAVDQMGGIIGIAPGEGPGATFWVELPFEKVLR
ncbi:MAG: response regulator [Oscillochloris sp.]|nr:response regulator [Oscillochloris sp.]